MKRSRFVLSGPFAHRQPIFNQTESPGPVGVSGFMTAREHSSWQKPVAIRDKAT
jgi:hypothetical protein